MNENHNPNNNSVELSKKKLHGKCHERDCLAKQEILSPLMNGDYRSRELYDLSSYKGKYKDFTSHLTRYVQRGYVLKLGKRPSFYQLTRTGYEECQNPFGYREDRVRAYHQNKKNNPDVIYVQADDDSVSVQQVNIPVPVSRDIGDEYDTHLLDNEKKSDNAPDDIITITLEEHELAKESWDNKMHKAVEYIKILKNDIETYKQKEINRQYAGKSQTEIKRIENRKGLVEYYNVNGYSLDYNFFNKWGMFPVWVKGKRLFAKGTVEILSKNDSELSRKGHTKGILHPQDIINGQYRITKMTKSGIHVIGAGMESEKFMSW